MAKGGWDEKPKTASQFQQRVSQAFGRKASSKASNSLTAQLRFWWLRAVTISAMLYIITSQALLGIGGWSLLGFVFAILLAVLLAAGRLLGLLNLEVGRWIWIPCFFVGYCILRSFSGLQYSDPLDVLSALVSAYLGGIGVAAALQTGMRFRALVYAQLVSSLCQIGAGFYGVGTEPAPPETEVRYAGLTGNANEFGLQLTLGACLIWLLPRRAGIAGCCFAFIAAAYAVTTSGSRQALFVGFMFLVIVIVQAVAMTKKHRPLLVGSLIGALVLAGAFLGPLLLDRARDVKSIQRAMEFETDSSYHKRLGMVEQGLRLWEQAPLLGNGLDAFRGLSGEGTYAHNNFMEVLCDLGVAGALLFYAIHGRIILNALRLTGASRLSCLLFILLLLALDMASVGYKRKQTVMVLMVLMAMTGIPVPESRQKRSIQYYQVPRLARGGRTPWSRTLADASHTGCGTEGEAIVEGGQP